MNGKEYLEAKKYNTEIYKKYLDLYLNYIKIDFKYKIEYENERNIIFSFNTHNVKHMNHMFCDCKNLIYVDLSSFNTYNVTNMDYMFYSCNNLLYLDLSSFNTHNVKNMEYMFSFCNNCYMLIYHHLIQLM